MVGRLKLRCLVLLVVLASVSDGVTTSEGGRVVPDTFFSTRFLCERANLIICTITESQDTFNTPCLTAAFPLGSFTLREPSIVIVSIIAGVTSILSSVKIFKNEDAEGHIEYAIAFFFFGLASILSMICRSFAYTPGSLNTFLVLIAMLTTCLMYYSTLFMAINDVGLMPAKIWLRVGIIVIGLAAASIGVVASILAKSAGGMFTFCYILPIGSYVVYYVSSVIHCSRHRRLMGFVWLFGATAIYIIATLCRFVLFNGICKALSSNFDGTFFYYVLIDGVMICTYKFFIAIRQEELDDEEMVNNGACF